MCLDLLPSIIQPLLVYQVYVSLYSPLPTDPVTGVLGRDTLLYLDREREDEYTLTVTASDGGSPSNPTPVSVTITLEDENDIVPTFDLPQFSTTIREDIEAATTVIQLIALDGDSEENGQLTYSITSVSGPSSGVNAPSGSFVIDEGSGLVRTSGSFDREAFEGPYTVMVSWSLFILYGANFHSFITC